MLKTFWPFKTLCSQMTCEAAKLFVPWALSLRLQADQTYVHEEEEHG